MTARPYFAPDAAELADHWPVCGCCGDVTAPRDMATDATHCEDHLDAMAARFGPVCRTCADEYEPCHECGTPYASADMTPTDEGRCCDDCLPAYEHETKAIRADADWLAGGYR